MNLIAFWTVESYCYQVWETDPNEFSCLWIDEDTLETVCRGVGETPQEAVADSLRRSLFQARWRKGLEPGTDVVQ